MKISYNWLKEYLTLDLPSEQLSEVLTDIGLEVEGVHTVESIKGGLKGVVIGEVLTCAQHPNADKLSVTTVDAGTGTTLHIVCGAPNVAAGQKVLVALVGTEIHLPDGTSFKIKEAKIRGELSQGMLCAEDELGLGTGHDGIMVLPSDAVIGTPASTYFNIEQDEIFEIGLTPNRADANSHFGVARDLFAALRFHIKYVGSLNMPETWSAETAAMCPISIQIENTEACTHYTGLLIEGIQIGSSPDWLQKRLQAIGQRPVNNIVDITNYVMFELGQPLHAFDADKIQGNTIRIKNLPEGTTFKVLDGTEKKLHHEDLLICDGTDTPMCLAGVFGGLDSGVTEQTTRIFIESAHFAATPIRRTSFRHNLRTESAAHFEKGTDPNQCINSLKRAAHLILQIAGGTVIGGITESYPNPAPPAVVSFNPTFARQFIGKDISDAEMAQIFELLGMKVDRGQLPADHWQVEVSSHKTDVTRQADLIEEIVRIYGLNQIEASPKIAFSISDHVTANDHGIKDFTSTFLTSNGFMEAMSLSIVNGSQWSKWTDFPADQGVRINNTSNIQLDLMRPDPLASVLEIAAYNLARQQPDLRMYEFGRIFNKNQAGEYIEEPFLSLFGTGRLMEESWMTKGGQIDSFYLKSVVINLLEHLGITKYQITNGTGDDRFENVLEIIAKGRLVAKIGNIQTTILRKAGIKQALHMAHIYWANVIAVLEPNPVVFAEFTRFPIVRRDLAVVVDEQIQFEEFRKIAKKVVGPQLDKMILFDIYKHDEHIGAGKQSLSIAFYFTNKEKTFTDTEIDGFIKKLIAEFESKLKGQIRK